ncbi:two-component sensor histidine kinase [Apibacter muscae]|uniref:sensor histidine kinase n=1 Tax=Apibacter muscae TaxID=2509004 RepID=UPI0011AC8E3D|nr:ATP-binding protein [Apibacter muscae]TWP28575.1 two-component sensor histidine kinase [Apibacter muscae]
MKLSYKHKIFFTFLIIFALYSFVLVFFQQKEEKKFKTEALENSLANYTQIIHNYVQQEHLLKNNLEISKVNHLADLLPKDIRITLIARDGKVLYDNDVQNIQKLENHLNRPEIKQTLYLRDRGINIRKSVSTQHEYMYYAQLFDNYFVRVALPYNIQTQKFFKTDNAFIYLTIIIFILVLILLNAVANRFNKSIVQLKLLVSQVKEGKHLSAQVTFQDDDLGEVGEELQEIFQQKLESEKQLKQEQEKIIFHFQHVEEGVGIFNSDNSVIYYNSQLIQYINLLTDQPSLELKEIFKQDFFRPVTEFLSKTDENLNHTSITIYKEDKVWLIEAIKFKDNSFEIQIKDITKAERTRLIKQEMSNNITHELRTPVTSIRAYLETLNEQTLPLDKQQLFINKAYQQSIRLSDLVEDIGLISKLEEAKEQFKKEPVSIYQLIQEVRINLSDRLIANKIQLNLLVDKALTLQGNYTLLFSVFQNLMENSINYGGENIEIIIDNYKEDESYLYFSYSDTGKGLDEKYFNRLFERFYRAQEGRTRNNGGTGLGLSIVKNAIQLHGGEIFIKKNIPSGLTFLFTLKKS